MKILKNKRGGVNVFITAALALVGIFGLPLFYALINNPAMIWLVGIIAGLYLVQKVMR